MSETNGQVLLLRRGTTDADSISLLRSAGYAAVEVDDLDDARLLLASGENIGGWDMLMAAMKAMSHTDGTSSAATMRKVFVDAMFANMTERQKSQEQP